MVESLGPTLVTPKSIVNDVAIIGGLGLGAISRVGLMGASSVPPVGLRRLLVSL